MKKKTRFSRNGYYKPTPYNLRKLGDALLAMSTFVSAFAISQDYKCIAVTSVIVGGIGKFLTNFFSEENV